ncbi:MAG: FIST N-terminal domain-containing protein, partial [Campylobacterota bacterium]|nr:FIST N-terminal domain-containing protein [Campylobacterota bacterium]
IEDADDAKVAIVFTDGLNINGEVFLKAFNKYIPNITVAGGLAADNALFDKTYVFTDDGILNNCAVAAVLYNPDLIVNTTFSFGWETIGKEFTVTKAIENRVYTIDNQTPLELYRKYLGDKIGDQLPATGIEFPLIINRDGRKIARAVVAKEDDGSLIFAGNINTGDKAWLGYGNVEHILDNITDTFNDIVSNSVESIFIYSCMARKRLLGDEIQTEIMPLSKIAPVSGFFTYGEFYNCNKVNSCKNQLLNQTMTILALSEDKNKINSNQTIELPSLKKNMQTVEALSHLISQSTLELNDLNENLEKRVHEEIEKNRQKDQHIVQQSRLAQMGEMISMIAHQWRQPLNAISLTSSNLKFKCMMNDMDAKVFEKEIDLIDEYSQHLSTTIDDFRGFFKENKEKEETSLKDIVNSTLDIVKTSVENKGITINTDLQCDEKFETYPNEIKQVVLNLIKNAEDALQEVALGNILLDNSICDKSDSTSCHKNPTITIQTLCDETKDIKTIIIKDNGGGIPQDIKDKIFDPYF